MTAKRLGSGANTPAPFRNFAQGLGDERRSRRKQARQNRRQWGIRRSVPDHVEIRSLEACDIRAAHQQMLRTATLADKFWLVGAYGTRDGVGRKR